MKVLIYGGPKTGKTTMSLALNNGAVFHGDDLLGKLGWSDTSERVSTWIERDGPWIIEGVQVGRALRKWLERHAGDEKKPADWIYYLTKPHASRTKGQETMAKGCHTVWEDIEPELQRRGVQIIYHDT